MASYIPSRDAELVTWSTNFDTKITAAPTDYGLTAPQATAYAAKHTAFVTAYQTASNPDTRSPTNVLAKDMARSALVAEARMLARIVQATPAVTPEQKSELGLTVRDVEPSPIPAPDFAPAINILSAVGNMVNVRIYDPVNPTRRGKPLGVAGAAIFTHIGENPPADISAWTFEGNQSRTAFTINFPAGTAAGAKVWVTAFWFNAKLQRGPASAPASTNLPGGSAMAA